MSDHQRMLARYADVAVQIGVNLQPGRDLILRSDIKAEPLVHEVVRSAYEHGARFVHVFYSDEHNQLTRYKLAPRDSFGYVPPYIHDAITRLVDDGAGMLFISSENPELLADQDPALMATADKAYGQLWQPYFERITSGVFNWSIIAAPSADWAAKVFPELDEAARIPKLWETIFATCRLDQDDPVAAWKTHINNLHQRSDFLNAKRFQSLHYTGPGTDLLLGLAEGHIWISGSMKSQKNIEFIANMPTEEVFTMPHAARVHGTVRATKPLNIGGTLVEDFSLTFEHGRVTRLQARRGEDRLRKLIETDEGAARLGEVALVPENSPIARSNILFYNTLFDENAACHIALGEAYRFTVEGGLEMDKASYEAVGGNESITHNDFMIGSAEIDIDGVHADGSTEPVMRRGEWAF